MKLRHRITSAVSIVLILIFPLEIVFAKAKVYLEDDDYNEHIEVYLPNWIEVTSKRQDADFLVNRNHHRIYVYELLTGKRMEEEL